MSYFLLITFYSVAVVDSNPPVVSGCPQHTTYNVPAGTPSRVTDWIEPTATDDCGVPTTIRSHRPGESFNVGVTQVTYIFTDSSGNTGLCSFTITGKYYHCLCANQLQHKKKPEFVSHFKQNIYICSSAYKLKVWAVILFYAQNKKKYDLLVFQFFDSLP